MLNSPDSWIGVHVEWEPAGGELVAVGLTGGGRAAGPWVEVLVDAGELLDAGLAEGVTVTVGTPLPDELDADEDEPDPETTMIAATTTAAATAPAAAAISQRDDPGRCTGPVL